MYVDLNQATEAPAISLQVASRDREGFELTCIMKPCSRKDLCFVAGEKVLRRLAQENQTSRLPQSWVAPPSTSEVKSLCPKRVLRCQSGSPGPSQFPGALFRSCRMDLDLSQAFERRGAEMYEGLEHESRTIPFLSQVRVTGRLTEEQNDQVDCRCWVRLIGCNIDASYDTCADSSAGRHYHANRSCLRCGQDTD
jgi:hypothetical protein